MQKLIRTHKNDKYKKVYAKFIIPKPDKKSILMSKKFHGGVLMDMWPYISSIPRLFNLKNLLKRKKRTIKNKEKLIMSIKFLINFKEGDYDGIFKFGGKYTNEIKIINKGKISFIKRVFSPPDNECLVLKSINQKREKITKLKKDNCFENFFTEVLRIVKENRYSFYYKRMRHDIYFRINLNKKVI